MGTVLELINGSKLCPEMITLKEQIDKFVSETLNPYIKTCKSYSDNKELSCNNTKNFYDSVWGTIEINEGEILLLDSPIIQRLRKLKQLGLADLLYSSADHSRFSHTLGVLQTANTMALQLKSELAKQRIIIEKQMPQIIRLAAIFHDCGHMFCSHASERYFQNDYRFSNFNLVDKVRGSFRKKIKIEPSITEIISMLIVNSTSMRNLLEIISGGFSELTFNKSNADKIIENICCLIIGYPYSEKTLPFSQIISGQIDADKLDYLKRDSHSTGVPVAVDMSRVFQKLRVVRNEKPMTMLSNSEKSDEKYKLGIAPAAINTVDQLIISRYMMFENVYFHQKTLTSEEQLRNAIYKLDIATTGLFDSFLNIMKLTDSIIVSNDFNISKQILNIDVNVKEDKRELYNEACRLLASIYKRELFKRCVAFTSDNLTDIAQLGKEFYTKLFVDKKQDEQTGFIELVIEETNSLKEILSDQDKGFNSHTNILLIVSPDISSISLNSNLAIADKMNRDRDMVFEADNWLKSRTSRKPQNYIVTYPEDRYLTYIAAEKVLFTRYGLQINDTILYNDKEEAKIEELKKSLEQKGYYTDSIPLIPNDYFDIHMDKIDELVKKWQCYERFDIERGERTKIDKSILLTFIKQFYQFKDESNDFDIFIDGCLNMLSSVQIVDRNRILQSLKANVKKILEDSSMEESELEICAIGNLQDGSAQMSYHVNELNKLWNQTWSVKSISDFTIKNFPKNIVFIEDAFGTAKQIISIFETYMGVPLEKRQTKENHVQELSSDLKDKLRNCKLLFSFIFYNKDNEKYFYDRMKDIGLENVEIIASQEFNPKYFDESDDELAVVKKYFITAGKLLMKTKAYENGELKENWNIERVNTSLLGYDDSQQLIVFQWNTPTYTLTPLWLGSNTDSGRWYPLFPRIDK